MKVEFSEKVVFTPTWRDNDKSPPKDQLKATFTLLDMEQFIAVREAISEVGVKDGDSEKGLTNGQLRLIAIQSRKYLPAHTELSGVEGLTLEQVVKFATFFDLSAELLFKLVNESAPKELDIKN